MAVAKSLSKDEERSEITGMGEVLEIVLRCVLFGFGVDADPCHLSEFQCT